MVPNLEKKRYFSASHSSFQLDTVITLRRSENYDPRDGARFEVHYEKARGFYGDAATPFEAHLREEKGRLSWSIQKLEQAQLKQVLTLRRFDTTRDFRRTWVRSRNSESKAERIQRKWKFDWLNEFVKFLFQCSTPRPWNSGTRSQLRNKDGNRCGTRALGSLSGLVLERNKKWNKGGTDRQNLVPRELSCGTRNCQDLPTNFTPSADL
jgi:hypothetical protein